MKIKTLGRAFGAFEAAAFGVSGYLLYKNLFNLDYNQLASIIPQDKLLKFYALELALAPIVLLGIADGLTDVVKGTHHYFGCKVWQKLTRIRETKQGIERDLEFQLRRIEEDI